MRTRLLSIVTVATLTAAGCSSGGDEPAEAAPTTTQAAPTTTQAAPTTTEPPGEFEPVGTDLTTPLPAGDAATGDQLYNANGSCAGCHLLVEPRILLDAGVRIKAPSLFGIAERAGTTIEAYSAEQYLRESIVLPCEFLAAEAVVCQMPRNYGERLDAQDVADLIAFMMTQSG